VRELALPSGWDGIGGNEICERTSTLYGGVGYFYRNECSFGNDTLPPAFSMTTRNDYNVAKNRKAASEMRASFN